MNGDGEVQNLAIGLPVRTRNQKTHNKNMKKRGGQRDGESTILTSTCNHARPQARNEPRRNHAGVGTPSAHSTAGTPMATPQRTRPRRERGIHIRLRRERKQLTVGPAQGGARNRDNSDAQ